LTVCPATKQLFREARKAITSAIWLASARHKRRFFYTEEDWRKVAHWLGIGQKK